MKLQRYGRANFCEWGHWLLPYVSLSATFALIPILMMTTIAVAQDLTTTSPDPQIAAALRQISASRIQANIEKLVSFQTRSTLSAQDQASITAGQGIGAAREWIKSEFERYARDCGGCLEVKTDTFTEAPASRIPKSTEITDIYAVMKGGDPESAKRIVLVTGHYDSRNSDTLDSIGVAPGANDDGSATVFVGAVDRIGGMEWRVAYTLRPGSAVLDGGISGVFGDGDGFEAGRKFGQLVAV